MLKKIQEVYRTYGLSVASDVQSVRAVTKAVFEEFSSAGGDETSLAVLRESDGAKKSGLKKALAASEASLVDGERRIEELEQSKDILVVLATKIDKGEAKLKTSEGLMCFLDDRVSERSNQ